MYTDIGEKIKTLAKVLALIGIIGGFVLGLAMALVLGLAVMGLFYMIAIPLISWISSWILYGFGELITTNAEIAVNTRGFSNPPANYAPGPRPAYPPQQDTYTPPQPQQDFQGGHYPDAYKG